MGDQTSHARSPSVHDAPSDSIQPGAIVAGRYRLIARSGSGAMGTVFSAKHIALGSTVAIKFLHPEVVASEDARSRFAREAKIAARLGERSRYIVRVTDYGVVDEVGPFIVMEYLQGEELTTRLRRQGRISLLEAVQIVAQLCRALEVAHQAGVVHRDIKPANVFLARPHTNMSVFVKLMDFGVAKLLASTGGARDSTAEPPHATRVGAVIGTPAYMSPEQLLAQAIDHRTDLFGVAALTYRMLTGEFPFGNGTLSEMGVRIVTLMPRPPTEIVRDLPKAIDAWFEKALAKSPDDRFDSASALAAAFAEAAGIELGVALPRAVYATPVPSSERLPESGVRLAAEPASAHALRRHASGVRQVRRRRLWPIFLFIAFVVAMAGASVVFIMGTETVDQLEQTLPSTQKPRR